MIYTQLRRIIAYEREVREFEWEGAKRYIQGINNDLVQKLGGDKETPKMFTKW